MLSMLIVQFDFQHYIIATQTGRNTEHQVKYQYEVYFEGMWLSYIFLSHNHHN